MYESSLVSPEVDRWVDRVTRRNEFVFHLQSWLSIRWTWNSPQVWLCLPLRNHFLSSEWPCYTNLYWRINSNRPVVWYDWILTEDLSVRIFIFNSFFIFCLLLIGLCSHQYVITLLISLSGPFRHLFVVGVIRPSTVLSLRAQQYNTFYMLKLFSKARYVSLSDFFSDPLIFPLILLFCYVTFCIKDFTKT